MPSAVDGVITITTAGQLAALTAAVNGGNNYSDVTIKLGADIDLSAHEWTAIGTSSNYFKGTFDGAGYTISGLTGSVGLFGYNKGTIQNVTLTGVNVSAKNVVGGLVSVNGEFSSGTSNVNVTIKNCTIIGTVTGTGDNVGGLVGQNSNSVSGNKFYSTNSTDIGGSTGSPTVENNTRHYKIDYKTDAVKNIVTVAGDTIDDGTTTYYAGTVTLTEKTGYVFSTNDTSITGNSFTITEDTTVGASLNTNGHYVFSDGNGGYTLATAENVGDYLELTQVYELTLPDGNKAYVTAGSVTLTGNLSVGYVLDSGNTFNVTQDTTVGVIFDEANHYVFSTEGNNYTLATKDNATGQALTQVFTLNLSEGVTATVTEGQAVKIGKTTYYFANTVVKLEQAPCYTIDSISVDDAEFTNETFTVTANATVTADISYIFNKADTATATGVIVMKQSGDLSTFNGVYLISASQDDSTLTGNAKNNTVILKGGGENILTGGGGGKQAVLSATKLKTLFRDDSELTGDLKTQLTTLSTNLGIGDLHLPAVDALSQSPQASYSDDNG